MIREEIPTPQRAYPGANAAKSVQVTGKKLLPDAAGESVSMPFGINRFHPIVLARRPDPGLTGPCLTLVRLIQLLQTIRPPSSFNAKN